MINAFIVRFSALLSLASVVDSKVKLSNVKLFWLNKYMLQLVYLG